MAALATPALQAVVHNVAGPVKYATQFYATYVVGDLISYGIFGLENTEDSFFK